MNKTVLLNQQIISQKIRRIAYQILEDNFDEKEIVLVAIQNSGEALSHRLASALKSIDNSLIVSDFILQIEKDSPLKSSSNLTKGYAKDKLIVLVDDVANTGRTMFYALLPIIQLSPKKVQTVVLVDRQHKLFPVSCDFVGLSLSTTLQEHITVSLGDNAQDDNVYLH